MSRPENVNRTCDLLAAYELGLLEEAERTGFEEHLPGCPDCLESLYTMAPLTEAMRQEPGRFVDAMEKAARRSLWQRLTARLFTPAGLGVAAPVVAAAVLAFVVLMPGDPGSDAWLDLAVLEPAPYTQLDLRGARQDQAAALFQQGMAAYAGGRYGEAAASLAQADQALAGLSAQDRPSGHVLEQVALYRGISLLLDGQAAAAAVILEKTADSPLPPIAQQARWYLAQARLADGHPQAATAQLEALADSPVFGERARQQIQEIEARLAP